jgi:hypothetical protein
VTFNKEFGMIINDLYALRLNRYNMSISIAKIKQLLINNIYKCNLFITIKISLKDL